MIGEGMSKKKRSKRTYQRENKIQSSKTITFPKNMDVYISYEKGQFILADKNGVPYHLGSQSMIRTYKGKNKERVVAKATKLDYVTDQVGSWLLNFDFIFAMDTNTNSVKCGDFFCSAAAIYYADIERVNDYSGNMTCRPYMIIDWYHPQEMKIEAVTWIEVIEKLQEVIPNDKKVGIVIDSELGNLEKYNNRTKPISGQWFLPENYAFIYATADVSDEWCNKMIKQCDKSATQRLKEIIKSPRLTRNPAGGNAPIGFITFWDNKLIAKE